MNWKRLAAWTTLLVAVWLLGSFLVAYRITRRPRPIYPEPVPVVVWGELQSLRIATADGEELGAWFSEGQPEKPVVLLLHGHRGSRGNCLAQAEIFATAGCGVLLVTLRSHGDSTGCFNDIGYSSRHDVLAAVSWIEKRYEGRRVVIYGQSMGAAAATFAAAELGSRVHGYILESPYKNLRTAVWHRANRALPPGIDLVAYAGLAAVAPLVLPDLDRISPEEAAAGMPSLIPVLVLAGGADRLARPDESRAIVDRIGISARLMIFEGASHARLQTTDPAAYREALTEMASGGR